MTVDLLATDIKKFLKWKMRKAEMTHGSSSKK
jgi:hypothetical protein